MQLQILDCDYVLVNNKPIIRIFGKTKKGENICVFYDKFLPYFYLHSSEDQYPQIIKELKEKFDVKCEALERILPLGYQEPIKILKITGKNPAQTPAIREYTKQFGTPYEADILFRYRFMGDHDLKGMGWIEVTGKTTHTKTVKCEAIEANEIKPIELQKNAPLKYMAVDIECLASEKRIASPEEDQIIIIGLSFFPDYKGETELTLLAKPFSGKNVIGCQDEKEMLLKLLEILRDYDPDILVGYNINNFDFPYIVRRLEILGLPRDIGRSEKNAFARKLQHTFVPSVSGRVVVDPFEILRRDPWLKFKRYDLATVAKEMLNEEKISLSGPLEINRLWNGTQEDLRKLINYSRKDTSLAQSLVLKKGLIDKFFELSKISGLLLQDSFGGQSQRHEFNLLNAFYHKKFVMPCKPSETQFNRRMVERGKSGLKGALVLEPEVGLHADGYTLVLDFTSLYPSIIKTYNICPTTYLPTDTGLDHITTPTNAKFVKPEVRKGIFPTVVKQLIQTRAEVRKQINLEKDWEQRKILNAKQLALKDMANSLYGYTGYMRARLYLMDVANTITGFGRDAITKTKKLIEDNFPVKILYSDTDSVFIRTDTKDLNEAEQLGLEISSFVTNRLRGLELKSEKLYKTFLILTKKRYAGWSFEKINGEWRDSIEMKGIETVRRDWCTLTSETMLDIIKIILKEQDVTKAAKYVRKILDDLSSGKIPLEKLTVVKGISKSIESYDGIQPHVELAKKLFKRDPSKKSMVGQRLEYVIIKGNQMLSKRAEDPVWVKKRGLQIDSRYYIENQLLPPLERIFEACGIGKSELIEGSRQKSLTDILNGQKQPSPEKIVLKSFDSIVCKNCDWSFRRPPLGGSCPNCSSELFFSGDGSIGKTIKLDLKTIK